MKKHIFIYCLAVILALSLTACQNNNIEDNQSSGNITNTTSKEKEDLKNFAIETLGMTEEEFETNVISFQENEDFVLVQFLLDYPKGASLYGMNLLNYGVQLKQQLKDETQDTPVLSEGNSTIYMTKNNTNGEITIFALEEFADGLCYQRKSLYQITKNQTTLEFEELLRCNCDTQKEEQLRNEIDQNSSVSEEETLDELLKAHTLQYLVSGNVVSKEDYDKKVTELKEKYTLIKTVKES